MEEEDDGRVWSASPRPVVASGVRCGREEEEKRKSSLPAEEGCYGGLTQSRPTASRPAGTARIAIDSKPPHGSSPFGHVANSSCPNHLQAFGGFVQTTYKPSVVLSRIRPTGRMAVLVRCSRKDEGQVRRTKVKWAGRGGPALPGRDLACCPMGAARRTNGSVHRPGVFLRWRGGRCRRNAGFPEKNSREPRGLGARSEFSSGAAAEWSGAVTRPLGAMDRPKGATR